MNDKSHFSIQFQITGERAHFDTADTGSKETYLIPTYMALKGVCDKIYWVPGINWFIDRIRVISPILEDMEPDNVVYLRNVIYQVEAHIEWDAPLYSDNDHKKHYDIACRRLKQGGARAITLGRPYCAGAVAPVDIGNGEGPYDLLPGKVDLGEMFHSTLYKKDESGKSIPWCKAYHQCTMDHGYVNFIRPERCAKKVPIKAPHPVR